MKKNKYVSPAIEVTEIISEGLMAASVKVNATGFDNPLGTGEETTTADSKSNYSVWGEDEEE